MAEPVTSTQLVPLASQPLIGAAAAAATSPEDVLAGVVGVLQQAQQTLAHLAANGNKASAPAEVNAVKAAIEQVQSLQGAVASLQAMLVPQAPTPSLTAIAIPPAPRPTATAIPPAPMSRRALMNGAEGGDARGEDFYGSCQVAKRGDVDVDDFLRSNNLDSWLGLVFDMLSSSQRDDVMSKPFSLEGARNPNGIVMSRIKQVTSARRRIKMFIQVNDLGEGVVDRIGTLTDEQCEAVMETGMKIQRASNPSGVAMHRITEAIKKLPNSRSGHRGKLDRGDRDRCRDRTRPRGRRVGGSDDPMGLFANLRSDTNRRRTRSRSVSESFCSEPSPRGSSSGTSCSSSVSPRSGRARKPRRGHRRRRR